MAVLIVGVDLLPALVNDRPGVLRADRDVDQTRNGGTGDVDFTRRCKVAEAVHDLLAGSVQLADRRVLARLVLQLRILLRLPRGAVCRCGHIDEALLIDRDVIVLGRDIGGSRLSLLRGLEVSPEDVPRAVNDVLCADEAGELAVARQHDNALIRGGRNNIDSVVLVHRDRDRLVNGVLAEECARRLCENLLKVAVDVEDNDAVCIGIANVDLLGICEDTGGICEAVRHALIVDKLVDGELQLVVLIGDNDAVVGGIDDVNTSVRADKQVAGVVDLGLKPDVA